MVLTVNIKLIWFEPNDVLVTTIGLSGKKSKYDGFPKFHIVHVLSFNF